MSFSQWVLVAQNAPKIYWAGTAFLLGAGLKSPAARTAGVRAASFGLRATYHVSAGAARGLFGTTLVRGGTMTLGGGIARAGGYVAAGYLLGALVGTSIAYEFWGEEGRDEAIDFYTGQISREEIWQTYQTGFQSLY